MGGKEYNFLWLDNKLQQLLEPSHGGSVGPFSIACPSVPEPLALCLSVSIISRSLPSFRPYVVQMKYSTIPHQL